MVNAAVLFLALQLAPGGVEGDRLAPILERWRSGREEERLQALRDALALRKEIGAAGLARFAAPPVPQSWSRAEELLDLVSREKLLPWSALIIPLLQDRDLRIAWEAAYTLVRIEARGSVPALVPLLKGPDASLRPNVAYALLRLGATEHGPLVAPLLDDADPGVVLAALEILGRIRARDCSGRIVKFLESPSPTQRQAAVASLAAMGARDKADKIAERLGDEQVLVRWEALRALGRLKAREYAGQIVAAVDDDGGQAPGLEAMGSLGLRELAPHILPHLATPDAGIRWRAVKALGSIDAKHDAGRIAEMLADVDSFVRLTALQSLAAVGAAERAGEMLELLRDEEFEVGRTAAEEACALATPEQIKTVIPLLGDADPFVRWSALRLIVGAGAKQALPAVVAQFRSGKTVDRDVVWAIGRLDGREHRDKVAEALRNEDALVRQQAAFALARLSDRSEELEAAEKASEGPVKLAAGVALVRLGRRAPAWAAALLRDYARHREEPGYEPFPDEIVDALGAAYEKDLTAALSRELKTGKRIESVKDLEAALAKAGIVLAVDEPLELRRRLPAGSVLTARRALEWSFGGDTRLVPHQGRVAVMDGARALDHWQKRLDAP